MIQSTTLIPREMLAASWPANPTKWEFDDIPHPSDWGSVKVCSDKRFAHYLGRLVLKEGMGEAKMQKNQQLLGRLGELRETILGSIADIHTQEQAEVMARRFGRDGGRAMRRRGKPRAMRPPQRLSSW